MKTHKNLYARICAFDNLVLAAARARRGKRCRPATAQFELEREGELLRLQRELQDQSWRPGPYTAFTVHVPKVRLISAAPYRDRVVHHALCNIVEPLFDRGFIADSYACRRGKGTHRAIARFQEFARRYRYVLKADIRKYFPSIDHHILAGALARRIQDRDVLWLMQCIIASSNPQEPVNEYFPGDDLFTPFERRRGIPIGNLTSQFFANVYLDAFDHYVQEQLRCGAYLRYCDDFAVFGADKRWLAEVKAAMGERLAGLRLRLHPSKSQIFPVTQGADFLGFRVFPDHRLLRRDNVARFRRRLRRLAEALRTGRLGRSAVEASVQSWHAHAAFGNTGALRARLRAQAIF